MLSEFLTLFVKNIIILVNFQGELEDKRYHVNVIQNLKNHHVNNKRNDSNKKKDLISIVFEMVYIIDNIRIV